MSDTPIIQAVSPKSLWLTRLAWAISIVFNPFWTVCYALGGGPRGGFEATTFLSVIYLLPCIALAKGMEWAGVLSHWLMPTRRDRVRGMLVCAAWCLALPVLAWILVGLEEALRLFDEKMNAIGSLSLGFNAYRLWWKGGFVLGLTSLVGALASSFSKASLPMIGAVTAILIGIAYLYGHQILLRSLDPIEHLWIPSLEIVVFSGILLGSVWWALRYLKAHTRKEMWQGIGWGVLSGILSFGAYIAYTIVLLVTLDRP